MTQMPDNELECFLAAHPAVRFFDAFVNDLNTVERGKRIDRDGIAKVFSRGMPLPGSMFALDIEGGTIEATGLGFDDGDADRPCLPIPGTLVTVPWQADVAQLQLRMFEADGARFFGDPRAVLERQVDTLATLGLTPVVAIEYEFYLVDAQRGADGLPQPPRGPLTGRREYRTQINSMTDLNEYSPLLAEIDRVCRLQNIPATSSLAEYGPGQYEVNLAHAADALRVCDEALRFKRAVKSVARAHGCEATFLPKPYRDMAGSGLHVHVSLLDEHGSNVFAADAPLPAAALRHAIAGTLATLADGMALCAPGPNSFRRFRDEAYVPMHATWSLNNRGAAIRVPASDAANLRLEHRLAGADANPYLVVAWVLAGIHHGLTHALEPPPITTGNAYRHPQQQPGEPLPLAWGEAIERFAGSDHARHYFGEPFVNLYCTVKRGELQDFASHITPLEIARYLGPL
ncbi:MAG TPA: glutamine synthetase family protein [Steroidobacteraceae bacterium]|nr:glutamine synthetase family protein [Steroidobacteraceae bacterium]